MMTRILLSTTLLFSCSAFATMPFNNSGDQIQAIFVSPLVWKKIGGEVKSIRFISHKYNTSKYELSTTEYVNGKFVSCVFTADVTNTGDEIVPKWTVTGTDFSLCQN